MQHCLALIHSDADVTLEAQGSAGRAVHLQNKPRIRQHVNPFRPALQQLPDPVDWGCIYNDPQKPLVVDIGCATGRWLLLLARDSGLDCNWLGLDIRKPVTVVYLSRSMIGRSSPAACLRLSCRALNDVAFCKRSLLSVQQSGQRRSGLTAS
jgi:tRNA G46 methylase TrmB